MHPISLSVTLKEFKTIDSFEFFKFQNFNSCEIMLEYCNVLTPTVLAMKLNFSYRSIYHDGEDFVVYGY